MEGRLSDRAKKIFDDPEKAKLLMEFLLFPEKRKDISITIENGEVKIVKKDDNQPVVAE